MGFLNSIMFWDLLFLLVFTLSVILFLYKRRKRVVREGIMYLYKTQIGIKIIDKLAKKNPKFWKTMGYLVIAIGYILMIAMVALLAQFIYIFMQPDLVKIIKIPPLTPLIPYLPSLFKINWLPPFYFTYWILAIAIIAIVHEGFHGIYARLHNIKIKSTGFGFLGPFLAFFVEQDDKDMTKRPISQQLSVLGAGVFANILVGIVFYIIMALFFFSFFVPSGALFNAYAISSGPSVALQDADIGEDVINIQNINFTQVQVMNKSYFVYQEFLEPDYNFTNQEIIYYYQDQPAIRNKFLGESVVTQAAVTHIDNMPVIGHDALRSKLGDYNPGDNISIRIRINGEDKDYNITLGENYDNPGKPMLGIGYGGERNWKRALYDLVEMNYFKEPSTYYGPKDDSKWVKFVFDLLWWLVLINLSVALVNMLPVAIFDGGRFFYLTILGITKKEKIANMAFKGITILILLIIVWLMVLWGFGIR